MSTSGLTAGLRLMVLTDAVAARGRPILDVAGEALAGGATCIQLRDKGMGGRELCRLGEALAALCHARGALCLVNDRLDVALACGADGVHLGQDDLPVARARAVVGPDLIIGLSAATPEEARRAAADGADYLGTGAVFATASKADAGEPIGPGGLARVVAACPLPVVAIGGISAANAGAAVGAGAAGVAVIAAVMGADDPRGAARAILAAVDGARRP